MIHCLNSISRLSLCIAALTTTTVAQNIFTVDTTADTIDVNPGDGISADAAGNSSLRASIQEANALGGTSVIVLQAGARYRLTRAGAGEDAASTGDLDVSASAVLIQGNQSIVDASNLDRAFDVLQGARLGVNELTVINGLVRDASGGGFRSSGDLLLFRSTVVDCVAVGAGASGGGVFNSAGLLAVEESTLESNEADRAGGAIEANAGITWIHRSEFYDNQTGPNPGNGGAIHLTGSGFVDVDSSTFRGNVASREGGALWNSSTGFMIVELCDVDDNVSEGAAADDGGGGLFNDGGTMVVSRTSVTRNRAVVGAGSGGGVFNNDGQLLIFLSQIEDNFSSRAGGGIEALAGETTIWGSTLDRNRTGGAPGNGGGLHLTGAGTVVVDRTEVRANVATAEGGGLWNSAGGDMLVVRCEITANTASGDDADQGGGGIFNDGGTLTVDRSVVSWNVADGSAGSGGGLLNNGGMLEVVRSAFVGNDSMRAGGGVEDNAGTASFDRVDLLWNSTGAAPGNGGGLHITGASQVTMNVCSVEANDAASEGGGLWNSATGQLTVTNSSIRNNTAPIGPDLFNDGGTFLVDGMPVPVGP